MSERLKHAVLGTAGHIDHGKTELIKALTGIDTDRLTEEKERGISIDLGFAWIESIPGWKVGIVDVPGHERFIKNMLAGVAGIDGVVFVVAADEGIMPQSVEHADILDLLQVTRGIIALTKIDMVDEELAAVAEEDVRHYTANTFLRDAAIVKVSSITGEGLDDFRKALEHMVSGIDERPRGTYTRLPIDRAFVSEGFGTVVTGTLWSGSLGVGDRLEIVPQGASVRVRSVQVHGRQVERAEPGERTAASLHGVDYRSVRRGDVLASVGALRGTYMFDARLRMLSSASRRLANRARVRVHLGASEVLARVIILDRDELPPGDESLVQLRVESPAVCARGDRFVIRTYSPLRTVAGGSVIEPYAKKHKRFRPEVLEAMEAEETGDTASLIVEKTRSAGPSGVSVAELARELVIERAEMNEAVKKLVESDRLVALGADEVVHRSHFERLKNEVETICLQYQDQHPLRWGISKEELKSKLSSTLRGAPSTGFLAALLESLRDQGLLFMKPGRIRWGSGEVEMSSEDLRKRESLVNLFLKFRFSPPSQEEAMSSTGAHPDMLGELLDVGLLVKISGSLIYHSTVVKEIRERLRERLNDAGAISVGDLKDMLGITRKYAVPLLGYFDAIGVTRRRGDERIAGPSLEVSADSS